MSIKWLLTIAAWYVAWSVITSIFSKKTPNVVKKELDKVKDSKEETISVLFNNFLETQKNFFENIKKDLTTEENMTLLEKKKAEVISLFDEYKQEALVFIKDLTSSDEQRISLSKVKLENIYNEKKLKFNEIINELPESASEIKTKLLESFEDFKNKFKS